MLGFLFGKKGKFKLQPRMKIELEIVSPEGARSYFATVKEASKKRAVIYTPKEGGSYVPLEANEIIRCIALIEGTLYEVNLKIASTDLKEFEVIISTNIKYFDTLLTNVKEPDKMVIEKEVPLDFRAMRTSHVQKAVTKLVTKESLEMLTNLPVPGGTDLRIIFKVPESPILETEGKSETSQALDEESKKSKTKILFSEKSQESSMFEQFTQYLIHYLRRVDRRKEMEESGEIPKKDDSIASSLGKGYKDL